MSACLNLFLVRGESKMKIKLLIIIGLSGFLFNALSVRAETLQERTLEKSTQVENVNSIVVNEIDIDGNTIFSEDEIKKLVANFVNKEIKVEEIGNLATKITEYYSERGYFLSFAYVPLQDYVDGIVRIEVVEGYIEYISVKVNSGAIAPEYVEARLKKIQGRPISFRELETALILLERNDLIKSFKYEVNQGSREGLAVLSVEVETENRFRLILRANNKRSPFIGTFDRSITAGVISTIVPGDELYGAYSNTDGSNAGDVLYSLPINSNDGKLTLKYGNNSNDVVANPFAQIDPRTNFNYAEIGLVQPVVNNLNDRLDLGLSFSRGEINTSLLGEPFPTSRGADELGVTTGYALRFLQNYTHLGQRNRLKLNSQFSVGLGIFDANVGDDFDSQFLLWRGGSEYIRFFGENTRLVLRGALQFSNDGLSGLEQFAVGGPDTVRGYRSILVTGDNGGFASAEVRFSVAEPAKGHTLQLIPFIDFGTAWNNVGDNEEQNVLLSSGLELRYLIDRSLEVRAGYGLPIISNDENNLTNSLQENGFYFSVGYRLF